MVQSILFRCFMSANISNIIISDGWEKSSVKKFPMHSPFHLPRMLWCRKGGTAGFTYDKEAETRS